MLIQERDQQSKIIFQSKEPVSQHKPLQIPPMDSDDEDSEDEDGSEENGIVRPLPSYVFTYSLFLKIGTEIPFFLSEGFQNNPLTPPDFVV